ncbi:hypothetical protein ACWC2H_21160 [Streptomyces sp. 900105755]
MVQSAGSGCASHELAQYVADSARDDGTGQRAGQRVREGGMHRQTGHGAEAVGREGRDDQTSSFLAVTGRHADSLEKHLNPFAHGHV